MTAEQTNKGRTQHEIVKILRVGIGTVNRDPSWFHKNKETDYLERFPPPSA